MIDVKNVMESYILKYLKIKVIKDKWGYIVVNVINMLDL